MQEFPFLKKCAFEANGSSTAFHNFVSFLVKPRAGLPVAGVPHPELARGGRLLLEADARRAQGRGRDAAESAAMEAAPHEGKAEAGAAQ